VIRRKLAAADVGNADWQRDVSVSLEKVGDVRLAAGDRAGALSATRRAWRSGASSPPPMRAMPVGSARTCKLEFYKRGPRGPHV
jgi:hypothetical protein